MYVNNKKKKKEGKQKKKAPLRVKNVKPAPLDLFATNFSEKDIAKHDWNDRMFRFYMQRFRNDNERKRKLRIACLWKTLAYLQSLNVKNLGHSMGERNRKSIAVSGKAEVKVVANDSMDTARWLVEAGYKNVSCLVMSSRSKLGGGYKKGSRAQEEDIYRVSAVSLLHEDGMTHPTEMSLRIFEKTLVCRGSEVSEIRCSLY